MKRRRASRVVFLTLLVLLPASLLASSHREAPISALDDSADVTDWYAFVSYDHPDRVTMILNMDRLLEPANGPNYFPLDPNVLYEMAYGFLTNANVELGNYREAEQAAQWMLDLRPRNLPALTRVAYARELFGDAEGAIELMQMALESTAPSEVEDAAWILTQIGHLEFSRGRLLEAEQDLQQALRLFLAMHWGIWLS